MLAKMIDKIVSLKETKIFEIGGQTYTDGHLTRIPPHVDRPGHREGCEGRRNCDRDQDGRVHRRRHQGHGRSDPPRS